MRILYLHCFSGISGDMTLAALADAGADRDYIEAELRKLKLDPFSLNWRQVVKSGISALKMDVVLEAEQTGHGHRHYADIVKMIGESPLSGKVKERSLAIFESIGKAEGKIHNLPLEKVHFHEVGAMDSIIDVIGVSLALESLKIDRILSSPVPLGSGTVLCDHGLYPVPAPATLEMMKGLPIAPSPHQVELTTPTGAGIVSAVVDEITPGLPPMIVDAIGYGAGTRDLPGQPNVLRAVVGTPSLLHVDMPPVHAHHHEHAHEHSHEDSPHHHDHPHDHHHGHGRHDHKHEHDH